MMTKLFPNNTKRWQEENSGKDQIMEKREAFWIFIYEINEISSLFFNKVNFYTNLGDKRGAFGQNICLCKFLLEIIIC